MSAPPHVLPDDAANRQLVALTHPADWPAPTPADRYNLVVIGGGPGGLVAAMGAAGLGGRVALVERHLLGGDCLVSGCVPCKALLAAAKAARVARGGGALGVRAEGVSVDFPAVMRRMRALRADIAHHDAAARFRDAGVDVFLGHGRFTRPDTVEVGGATLRFSRAVIATGARAALPPIPGLEAVGALTHEGLFELTELPRRLLVLGGGVIGCEMAQAFRAFGSEVTLVDLAERLLPRGDADASEVLADALRADGVRLVLGATVSRFEVDGGEKVAVVERGGESWRLPFDAALVAVGRTPNLDGLGLEAAGVQSSRGGVEVDDWMRTANPRVYAVGDVASRHQFTHAADAMARLVVQNALFFGRKRHSALVVPSCTFTSPEIATVGLVGAEAEAAGLRLFRADARDLDRTTLDGHTEGFVKVWAEPSGRIRGAAVVGERAGELINALSLAMTHGLGLGALSATIFAYPTESELLKRVGDAWNKTRLTPRAAGALRAVLQLRR